MIVSVLLPLSLVLITAVGLLCILIHKQQSLVLGKLRQQQQMLAATDASFRELSTQQTSMQKRLEQLSTDVLQREIYQNADDRHQLAIKSARQGKSLFELMQHHGLSSDEAALIMSLHSPSTTTVKQMIRNANLDDSAVAEEASVNLS